MLGSLSDLHIAKHIAIISDDAGQFNVLLHGLCWGQAERLVHKMLPLNDRQRVDSAQVRSQNWALGMPRYLFQPEKNVSKT